MDKIKEAIEENLFTTSLVCPVCQQRPQSPLQMAKFAQAARQAAADLT